MEIIKTTVTSVAFAAGIAADTPVELSIDARSATHPIEIDPNIKCVIDHIRVTLSVASGGQTATALDIGIFGSSDFGSAASTTVAAFDMFIDYISLAADDFVTFGDADVKYAAASDLNIPYRDASGGAQFHFAITPRGGTLTTAVMKIEIGWVRDRG